jgi:hypothetical protein
VHETRLFESDGALSVSVERHAIRKYSQKTGFRCGNGRTGLNKDRFVLRGDAVATFPTEIEDDPATRLF